MPSSVSCLTVSSPFCRATALIYLGCCCSQQYRIIMVRRWRLLDIMVSLHLQRQGYLCGMSTPPRLAGWSKDAIYFRDTGNTRHRRHPASQDQKDRLIQKCPKNEPSIPKNRSILRCEKRSETEEGPIINVCPRKCAPNFINRGSALARRRC